MGAAASTPQNHPCHNNNNTFSFCCQRGDTRTTRSWPHDLLPPALYRTGRPASCFSVPSVLRSSEEKWEAVPRRDTANSTDAGAEPGTPQVQRTPVSTVTPQQRDINTPDKGGCQSLRNLTVVVEYRAQSVNVCVTHTSHLVSQCHWSGPHWKEDGSVNGGVNGSLSLYISNLWWIIITRSPG